MSFVTRKNRLGRKGKGVHYSDSYTFPARNARIGLAHACTLRTTVLHGARTTAAVRDRLKKKLRPKNMFADRIDPRAKKRRMSVIA